MSRVGFGGGCIDRHFYVQSTTMDPFGKLPGLHREEDPWAREPGDECRHDRLPFDRTKPCGCFSEEGAVVVELPVFVQAGEDWRRVA